MRDNVWVIECDAAEIAAALRHAWIEGKLQNKNDEEILHLWRAGPWPALEQSQSRICKARELASNLGMSFGPGQLVDRLPDLLALDDTQRAAIRSSLQSKFDLRFRTAERSRLLRDAIDNLAESLAQLSAVWDTDREVNGQSILDAWQEVRQNSGVLLEELRKLPGGVVFP